ncbi:MAG: isoprenylcysteine carboxylmethyltransferase family protein [Candidatus Acidiferrales bacterium]
MTIALRLPLARVVRGISAIPIVPIQKLLGILWLGFGIYWAVSARQSGPTETTEANWFRALRFGILVTTFVLLLAPWLGFSILDTRAYPDSFAMRWVGAVLTTAGIGLAVSARRHLGKNWSDKVELKVDHQLIRSGPYAYMRHPIYSGVLLGVAGTALAIGMVRGGVAFCLLLSSYAIKARKEETVLAGKFGDEFREHQRNAGFLLPKFTRRGP